MSSHTLEIERGKHVKPQKNTTRTAHMSKLCWSRNSLFNYFSTHRTSLRWPNCEHYFTIGPLYRFIRVVAFRGIKCHPYGRQSKRGTITQFCFNVEPASNTMDQHESAMGCDAGPTSKRYWVGSATFVYEVQHN